MVLFEGFRGHHGTYGDTHVDSDGKVQIRGSAKTVKKEVTEELWALHLRGERHIGIVPVNEESLCFWGALDIDKVNHENVVRIAQNIQKIYPFFSVCKSKSGNLHAYVFFSEPVPAKEVRNGLLHIAATLGYADKEIFPKQDTVLYEKGDMGSWLNMPYFNESATQTYAISVSGEQMTAAAFIEKSKISKINYGQFINFLEKKIDASCVFKDAPPCIQNMRDNGITTNRNICLFQVATFLKKAKPADWFNELEKVNREWCDPPLPSEELASVIGSHRKKDYEYTCKQEPMMSFCNAKLCRTRKYGIKGSEDFAFPKLSAMTVFLSSPPIYFLDVNGIRTELSATEMTEQKLFRKKCFERAGIYPPALKDFDWSNLISNLRDTAVIIEAPEEASPEAEFLELLEDFILNSPSADSKEDILRGCVYLNTENKIYENSAAYQFRLTDLMNFLKRKDFKSFTGRNKITLFLKTHKGLAGENKNEKEIRKGQSAKTWVIRSDYFEISQEAFSIPDFSKKTII